MHQQVKDKLHYYSTTGLKVKCQDTGEIQILFGLSGLDNNTAETVSITDHELARLMATSKEDDEEYIIPFMRPLSSLTKEITVEGHNEGKPFVPKEELKKYIGDNVESVHIEFHNGHVFISASKDDIDFITYSIDVPFECYELLFRWHFWLWDQQLFATGDIIEIKD